MTVRFKCRSEYQKSYGASRSRSVSPQRCAPSAGLRSDLMGFCREPGLQRRRTGPLARSCSSLLFPPDDLAVGAPRRAPPAASRSRSAHRRGHSPHRRGHSAHRKGPSQNQKPPTPPETPAGPRPDVAEPPETPDPKSADGKSAKLRPSEPVSQSLARRAVTGTGDQQPSDNKVDQVLRWRAGLRSGGHRSEYHRQFSWKKPGPAASPLLTAELVLNSSRAVPPFRTNPVLMETEYGRSFRGLVPPTGPHLRKHLEHERVPLFHTHTIHKRVESHKPHPEQEIPEGENDRVQDTSHPPQVQKRLRMLSEYQSSFRSRLYRKSGGGATDAVTQQVRDLRHQAQSYRHRAWGTNFCRDHLNQLLSEHTALWEPTDTTDTETPTRRLTLDLSPEPDGRSTSCVEALDLPSSSSKRSSSIASSGGSGHAHKKTGPGPPAEPRTAWTEEEETDEGEGRLPTPRLKTRPVQRTHHDLTTPATGGAILVGKLQSADSSSANKQQKGGMDVSVTTGAELAAKSPDVRKEAWSEDVPSPSPEYKPASSPTGKPLGTKQTSRSPVAPPPLTSPPQHGIQGSMRHPDFQHNGELGLRSREQPCSRGGCCSDEVMSWRSAASCSAASAILERAQKRREDFWGKR